MKRCAVEQVLPPTAQHELSFFRQRKDQINECLLEIDLVLVDVPRPAVAPVGECDWDNNYGQDEPSLRDRV